MESALAHCCIDQHVLVGRHSVSARKIPVAIKQVATVGVRNAHGDCLGELEAAMEPE